MRPPVDAVAIAVFAVLFGLVTVLGFFAARWRRGDLDQLHEWGLGGRRFGTLISWFLLGGDLYTAYTFVALPALLFGAGAMGFFAVPYCIAIWPLLFVVFPRLWSVSHRHGYVTAADFVRGRFGSRTLALTVAVTGIVATMPYIALQLVGIEVVIAALGLHLSVNVAGVTVELPLLIAFVILAAYTYTSGLRAPAMIAVVKDLLIYGTVLAVVIVIPVQLGGYGHIFASVAPSKLILPALPKGGLGAQSAYATLALGSALALFLYPHSVTGILSSSGREVVKRNAVAMPLYAVALGLIALMGYMAIAAGLQTMPAYAEGFKAFGTNYAVPALLLHSFPSWMVGVALAAIAIGALVPAAIMSIASANLFTRNVYKEYINPNCSDAQESRIAKVASLIVKAGGLVFIIGFPQTYAIVLQLLGGIWIIQTLPAVMLGLYTRWLHPAALTLGWLTGIAAGTWMASTLSFKSATYVLHVAGLAVPCYAAVSALALNLLVAAALSALFNLASRGPRADATTAEDYV
ncbi:MAG: sodium:solute symporter [Alphaproteobacteria bacterium]|nr:sodium:solute symporter [Alphaproteobacteria bacterium]MDE2109606.1 sodium:solute symporter [Alphaproteobacteria bacterium]MDE2493026.1 sodium:solute symporter [Alphaproteobacteria bacterium]